MNPIIYYDESQKRWRAKCTISQLDRVMSALEKTQR